MRKVLQAIAAAAVTLAPTVADAACVPADVAGSWRIYVTTSEPGTPFNWSRCSFVVNSAGVISTSSRCVDSSNATATVAASSVLSLGTDCRITGSLYLNDNVPPTKYTITEGQVSRDLETTSGVGKYPGTGLFTFNGVRR